MRLRWYRVGWLALVFLSGLGLATGWAPDLFNAPDLSMRHVGAIGYLLGSVTTLLVVDLVRTYREEDS